MDWGRTEYIDRIEILESGELFLGIESDGDPDYQYVYREAAGVYWNPTLKGFRSTELKEWSPAQWFVHMTDIVRTGVGVNLVLRDSIQWKGLSDSEVRAIVATNVATQS